MSKKILIDEMMKAQGFSSAAEAERALTAVTTAIISATTRGQPIQLRGFGTFKEKLRAGRDIRNPRTGDMIHTQDKRVIVFSDKRA